MKILIIYDSVYGNTEQVARAMAEALAPSGEVTIGRPGETDPAMAGSCDLLVIGSPTQGGRAVAAVNEFLDRLPEAAGGNIRAATFDTRIPAKWVKLFGFAAGKIAGVLKGKGYPVVASEGFFVEKDKKVKMVDGELERAAAWAKGLVGG